MPRWSDVTSSSSHVTSLAAQSAARQQVRMRSETCSIRHSTSLSKKSNFATSFRRLIADVLPSTTTCRQSAFCRSRSPTTTSWKQPLAARSTKTDRNFPISDFFGDSFLSLSLRRRRSTLTVTSSSSSSLRRRRWPPRQPRLVAAAAAVRRLKFLSWCRISNPGRRGAESQVRDGTVAPVREGAGRRWSASRTQSAGRSTHSGKGILIEIGRIGCIGWNHTRGLSLY